MVDRDYGGTLWRRVYGETKSLSSYDAILCGFLSTGGVGRTIYGHVGEQWREMLWIEKVDSEETGCG